MGIGSVGRESVGRGEVGRGSVGRGEESHYEVDPLYIPRPSQFRVLF